jgi:hypothetical protein
MLPAFNPTYAVVLSDGKRFASPDGFGKAQRRNPIIQTAIRTRLAAVRFQTVM